MARLNRVFYIVRLIILGLASLFSPVTLALAARILSFFGGVRGGGRDPWAGMALAVALFTKLASITSYVTVAVFGSTTFVSWTAVELSVLGFLWILWIASAGWTTTIFRPANLGSCGPNSGYVIAEYQVVGTITMADAEAICSWVEAIMGCSWIAWLLLTTLLVWEIVLLVFALRAGHTGIWTSALWMYDARAPPAEFQSGKGWATYPMSEQGQGHTAPSHFVPQHAYVPLPAGGMGQGGGYGYSGGTNVGRGQYGQQQ
ncbi:hypothetical protein DACRYDRAFT_117089 [Dacryopinax primogenitus]|uniref:MARVEL domain-containing protein n=1 Tax=Dacryopinax primogenitus (strain DJM 731) TaxID=1858805 RepID=M5FXV0_DACPD|nr:uncharacterized protein DACRYDRAFT_117089 [Dacryopinax primogenitus]EJU00610.1 hypothetical protein DACRYDRAFT_117089 [Dacryopinax primogenitus]